MPFQLHICFRPLPKQLQELQYLEFFSGEANVFARVKKAFPATALDIEYLQNTWGTSTNAFDLLTPSGMALLGLKLYVRNILWYQDLGTKNAQVFIYTINQPTKWFYKNQMDILTRLGSSVGPPGYMPGYHGIKPMIYDIIWFCDYLLLLHATNIAPSTTLGFKINQ